MHYYYNNKSTQYFIVSGYVVLLSLQFPLSNWFKGYFMDIFPHYTTSSSTCLHIVRCIINIFAHHALHVMPFSDPHFLNFFALKKQGILIQKNGQSYIKQDHRKDLGSWHIVPLTNCQISTSFK